MFGKPRLLRRVALSGLLAGVLTAGTLTVASAAQADVAGSGNYANSQIATTALSYVGQWGGNACNDAQHGTGDSGGQCRAFVNCIVWMASNHTQNVSGGANYFAGFLNAGGVEITSADNLVTGDIVQKYVSSSDLHTVIIVRRVSGSTFDVVDSNYGHNVNGTWVFDEVVQEHNYTVSLSSTVRAFRMARPAFADGTFLADPAGRVYRMAGSAPIGLYNWGILPGFDGNSVTHVNYTDLNNLAAAPSNGTFISIYEAGGSGIYEFVGGAPLRQFNWGAIPGFDGGKVVTVNFDSLVHLDHMRAVPADGAFISIVEAGGSGIYRFVGGAPVRLYNWGALPDFDGGKVTGINFQTLVNLDHMNAVPSDGAFVSLVEAGGSGIYTFAGGAPLRLYNWGAVPSFDGGKVVNINAQSLGDHMNAVPSNGTWLASAETGIVYRVAGGAALRLYNWGSLPGFDGGKVVWVNQQTLDTNDHMNAVPSDGTILQGLPSGTYWQISGGHRVVVSAQSGAVQVDDQTVNNFPQQ